MTDPMPADDFYVHYAEALTAYLQSGTEASLAVGHELGRRALSERMSMLDIIENHSRLVEEIDAGHAARSRRRAAVPAADTGRARRGHPRIPRRHKALRTATRSCR